MLRLWSPSQALLLLVSMCMALVITGCESGDSVTPNPGQTVIVAPPQSNAVCSPLSDWGSGMSAQPEHGLMGDLYYRDQTTQPNFPSVYDYFTQGFKVNSLSLYFDRLFIPTRKFDLGFVTTNGEVITNNQGTTLYEYFAVHLESKIGLGPDDPAGPYQFAVLSDDGAVLQIQDLGMATYSTVVNNDRQTPTRFQSSTAPIFLNSQSRLPMKLEYNQGPRFHIALVLMWRPWPADSAEVGVYNGTSGNSLFFDYNVVPSLPQAAYYNLLDHGWKPMVTENFYLDNSNPCAPPDPLTVNQVTTANVAQASVDFTWITNHNADSQVELTMVATGVMTTSALESAQVTAHLVTMSGLTANTLYSYRVVSRSSSGEVVRSDAKTFRTLR